MNRITLHPGDALYMPAGNLHAYLSGGGMEIMANSDNVMRGGLTRKYVNVEELLAILDFTPGLRGLITPIEESPGRLALSNARAGVCVVAHRCRGELVPVPGSNRRANPAGNRR